MKRILLLTGILFLSSPVIASADDSKEVEGLKEQIEELEEIIESLNAEIDVLRNSSDAESNQEGIKDVDEVTEIYFNTEEGEYQIDEIFILPEGGPNSYYGDQPALLVLYDVTVKEDDEYAIFLFKFDVDTLQESQVAYTELETDVIEFYFTDYKEYFEHGSEDIIKKGANTKNATLFVLDNLEDPVVFKVDDTGYRIDLDNIEVKERSKPSRYNLD